MQSNVSQEEIDGLYAHILSYYGIHMNITGNLQHVEVETHKIIHIVAVLGAVVGDMFKVLAASYGRLFILQAIDKWAGGIQNYVKKNDPNQLIVIQDAMNKEPKKFDD